MMHRHAMGKEGLILSIIAAIVMVAGVYIFACPAQVTGELGIFLPSPNLWNLSPFLSHLLTLTMIAATTILLYVANKKYTFVTGSDTVFMGMFLVMCSSNVWLSDRFSSSFIFAIANVICLMILFDCYRKSNATQELFLIATIISLGSMIQYAFLALIVVYLLGAVMLKCFSFRGLIAFGMGLVAPYWVAIGLGIVPYTNFRMPEFSIIFNSAYSAGGILVSMINIGLTCIVGLIIALNNMVKLYAGNTQRRLNNMVINLLGVVSLICMLVDFNNIIAYLATIYMIVAIQLAHLFTLWNIRRAPVWLLIISLLYVGGYVLMLL